VEVHGVGDCVIELSSSSFSWWRWVDLLGRGCSARTHYASPLPMLSDGYFESGAGLRVLRSVAYCRRDNPAVS